MSAARRDFGEQLDLDAVLQDGVAARVWVQYDPGMSGGSVDPPEPGGFVAIAEDAAGAQVGCGFGGTALGGPAEPVPTAGDR